MKLVSPSNMVKRLTTVALVTASVGLLVGCAKTEIPAYMRPLPKDTMMLLGKKGMKSGSPIFVRIFKEESELELWKQREDGRFYHLKTYPICNWSGALGPKRRQGDRQAPEGFYQVDHRQMNPHSKYHLAMNLGYPNAFDRANERTGDFLMVHGKCKSAGCYAMTDALMEEIYALAREAFTGGQPIIHVHAFPFRMTPENLKRHKNNPNRRFWRTLKKGYDHFERTRLVPNVVVCERRYWVNVFHRASAPIEPEAYCPTLYRREFEPFVPLDGVRTAERVVVRGHKKRTASSYSRPSAQAHRSSFGNSYGLGRGLSSALGFGQ